VHNWSYLETAERTYDLVPRLRHCFRLCLINIIPTHLQSASLTSDKPQIHDPYSGIHETYSTTPPPKSPSSPPAVNLETTDPSDALHSQSPRGIRYRFLAARLQRLQCLPRHPMPTHEESHEVEVGIHLD
jgi:hypothetical protein